MVDSSSNATLENLSRLASKPGVQSTLVLSKADGSIIRKTGLLASASTAPDDESKGQRLDNGTTAAVEEYEGESKSDRKTKTAEEVAKMVFEFVDGAKAFAGGLNDNDDVKLLRMRTKKHELVIVPDVKFLLVVIHETPPA